MSLEDGSPESECLERLQEHEVRANAYYYEHDVMPPSGARLEASIVNSELYMM
ncbi:MAG: hypothetical protein K2L07_12075 [Lachnospiraceae bacterium]|nr:hypothetical protein [Lachnospiraceae bacterium]